MEKISVTISNLQLTQLGQTLSQLSVLSSIPIKFCIARNKEIVDEALTLFEKEKMECFQKHVLLNEEGSPIVDKLYQGPIGTYDQYIYGDKAQFFVELNELVHKGVELRLHQESCDRPIAISNVDDQGRTSYQSIPLSEILEDPSKGVTPENIQILLRHKILK